MVKPETPTKIELRVQIERLEAENAELRARLEAARKTIGWLTRVERAIAEAYSAEPEGE